MDKMFNTLFASLVVLTVVFPSSVLPADSFSFSGRIRENVGCLTIVPPPIKGATLTIYDNQSCIIDLQANQRTSHVYGGRLTSYHTTTDSSGHYCLNNLQADSFTCYPINQMVEATAEGYFPQRRDIVPQRDSLLDFDLLKASGDSTIPVTVTVVAVDTTVHGSPAALKNYRIEIPDRYLFWFSPQAKDTTDDNGKAEFRLSVVPYVEYTIVAKSLNGDNYRGEIIANIASCMGNTITIPVHIPGAGIQSERFMEKQANSVECFHQRTGSGVAVSVRIQGGGQRQGSNFMHIFDLKGKSIGFFKSDAGKEITDRGRIYTFTIGDLPVGMYLLKINIGKMNYSEKLLLSK